jgi:2-phosphosulfolactate phosphatase
MRRSDWPEVHVHLLPSLIPPGALRGGVAVVVDVLRATTFMVRALSMEVKAIIPCGEIEEARSVAAGYPPGKALLVGEREGLPIPGFDLGNSPAELGRMIVDDLRNKTLVMTTTNGTRAILASLEAEHVGIGAMINAGGAFQWAASWDLPVHIVCAGTDGQISLEDTMLAGEIACRLNMLFGYPLGNDEALISVGLFRDSLQLQRDEGVPRSVLIARGRGGRRVREIGLQKDIEAAAHPYRNDSWSKTVGVLERNPLRIVRWDWAGFE